MKMGSWLQCTNISLESINGYLMGDFSVPHISLNRLSALTVLSSTFKQCSWEYSTKHAPLQLMTWPTHPLVISAPDFDLSSHPTPNSQSMGSDRGDTWPKPSQSSVSTGDSNWSRIEHVTYTSWIINQVNIRTLLGQIQLFFSARSNPRQRRATILQ